MKRGRKYLRVVGPVRAPRHRGGDNRNSALRRKKKHASGEMGRPVRQRNRRAVRGMGPVDQRGDEFSLAQAPGDLQKRKVVGSDLERFDVPAPAERGPPFGQGAAGSEPATQPNPAQLEQAEMGGYDQRALPRSRAFLQAFNSISIILHDSLACSGGRAKPIQK